MLRSTKIFTALYVMCRNEMEEKVSAEKWPYCMKMKSVIRSTRASKQDIDKNAQTFFHSTIDEIFFPGKSIGACAYSAFIIDSWINIEHILWYFRSTYGGKERWRERIENVAADCAYGVRNQEKKRTHRDTKPIYAAEGYQKASNRTRLRRTRPEKKTTRQLQQQPQQQQQRKAGTCFKK